MRIVIADDSTLLREGLQALLTESGHEVVAAAADGPGLVAAALEHRPDVSIADVRMPPTNTDEGLRASLEIRRAWPDAAVMVLSQYVAPVYAQQLFALPNVPEPFRDSFLQRNPSNRALLAAADGD